MSQPAGWYRQPDGTQRYWDGASWTGQVAPGNATQGPTPPQNWGPSSPPQPFTPHAPVTTAVKAKKPIYKRVWFWLLIVFVVLPVLGSMITRGGSPSAVPAPGGTADTSSASAENRDPTEEPSVEPTEESEPDDQVAKIGDTIQVGDLAVTVKSAERTNKLSSVFGSKKGHWMLVTLKVANKGKEQVMVNDSDFTLIEPDGTSYSTDSDGMTYIDSDDWLFLKKINPKTSATGIILFSLPKSAKNLTLQASGGLFGMETGDVSLGNK